MSFRVGFGPNSPFPPLTLQEGDNLSEHLTVENSPILFGCRTGICGTCLVEVLDDDNGALHPRSENENDLLPIIASDNPRARLACQIRLNANIAIQPLKQS